MTTRTEALGRGVRLVLGTALLLGSLGARAFAGPDDMPSLDALRKSGTVGERYDGLVAIRTATSDPGIKRVVDSVNAKRSAIYADSAKKQNVPAVEVGKVYAMEVLAKSPPGTWFLGEDGVWKQKK